MLEICFKRYASIVFPPYFLGLVSVNFFLICFTTTSFSAGLTNEKETRDVRSHFLLGDCELSDDPLVHPPVAPILCLRGKIGIQSVLGIKHNSPRYIGAYIDRSFAIYFTSWLSSFGRGRARYFKDVLSSSTSDSYADAEYFIVQLGNPVKHKARVVLGQMRPPFGIDRQDVDEFYRLTENRAFWPGPTPSFAILFDDLLANSFEIGFARYFAEKRLGDLVYNNVNHDTISVRMMHDIASNGSTRLVLSGAADSAGPRYYSLGIVNLSQNRDQFSFEFARRMPFADGRSSLESPLIQLIRAGYIGNFVGKSRWVFHFDDEREAFRRGLAEYNYALAKYWLIRGGISYKIESRPPKVGTWYVITGFEGRL